MSSDEPARESALLISRSCTTGWLDWIHGELWLTGTALVRRRLSLATTVANRKKAAMASPVESAEMPGHLEPQRLTSAHRTNHYIPLADIATAHLKRGVLTDRLAVTLSDGSRHVLLWLAADPAYDVLRHALRDVLGDRFDLA